MPVQRQCFPGKDRDLHFNASEHTSADICPGEKQPFKPFKRATGSFFDEFDWTVYTKFCTKVALW
jgi:hypothetical protein